MRMVPNASPPFQKVSKGLAFVRLRVQPGPAGLSSTAQIVPGKQEREHKQPPGFQSKYLLHWLYFIIILSLFFTQYNLDISTLWGIYYHFRPHNNHTTRLTIYCTCLHNFSLPSLSHTQKIKKKKNLWKWKRRGLASRRSPLWQEFSDCLLLNSYLLFYWEFYFTLKHM